MEIRREEERGIHRTGSEGREMLLQTHLKEDTETLRIKGEMEVLKIEGDLTIQEFTSEESEGRTSAV